MPKSNPFAYGLMVHKFVNKKKTKDSSESDTTSSSSSSTSSSTSSSSSEENELKYAKGWWCDGSDFGSTFKYDGKTYNSTGWWYGPEKTRSQMKRNLHSHFESLKRNGEIKQYIIVETEAEP